jgi:PAS domain-containing protein
MTSRAHSLDHHPAVPSELPKLLELPTVPMAEVKQELQQIVAESLPKICAALACLFAFHAAAQFFLPFGGALIVAKFSLGIALLCAVAWMIIAKYTLPGRWAHPCASFLAGLILIAQLLQIYVTQDPWQTSHLFLLILGAGSLFLGLDWFMIVAGAALLCWSALAFVLFSKAIWFNYGLALVLSITLGFIIQTVRLRGMEGLEMLKLQNNLRQGVLLEAIQSARSARERFHLLSEACGEGVLILSKDRISDANFVAARLFEYPVNELIGRPLADLVSPSYHHVIQCATAGSADRVLDIYALRSNRSLFPAQFTNGSIVVNGREIHAVRVRATTSPRQTEDSGLIDEKRLAKKIKRHEALGAARVLCGQARNFTEATEHALGVVDREFPVSLGSIFLSKGLRENFNVIASTVPGIKSGVEIRAANSPKNLLKLVLNEPEPLLLSEISKKDFELEQLFPGVQAKALAVIPVMNGGKFLALMLCFESSPRKYDKDDVEFLTGITATTFAAR